MDKVRIFDTTLRDGEQSPGCSMSAKEKLVMARQLERLGVDVIEAGFAAASPGDFESVQAIGQQAESALVISLCRAKKKDIDRGVEALKGTKNWGIHTFIASSDLHMKSKLQMEPKEVISCAVQAVECARKHTENVEFSAEDATRSNPHFLVELLSEVVKAGATTLNIPDTVGYTTPDEMFELTQRLREEVYQADQVIFSVHCHNDLGMAVSNSLAALRAGARQIECTLNGIGERAGNAAMEEIVMALHIRSQLYQIETNIRTEQIYPTSKLLTQITGISVQPNKAIVGANAFAHEAGIHQHGVLNNPLTYEIMTPQSVGIKTNNLVLGKHSGRHALSEKIIELGFAINEDHLNQVFQEFKRLADLKKQVFDEDIEALITNHIRKQDNIYELEQLVVSSGTSATPTATVILKIRGESIKKASFGDGPVDAVFNTIKEITGYSCILNYYNVKAITGGTDAQGEVSVGVEHLHKQVTGRGSHTDIVIASALAFIDALNRIETRSAALNSAQTIQEDLIQIL